jgi:aerobic C4-dicarboxylate transport protein
MQLYIYKTLVNNVQPTIMKKIISSLYVQVIIAILMGMLVGHYFSSFAITCKPLGDGFIKLIKMLVAPIVFCSIVNGIAGMQNTKKVGRVGLKALLYFEVVSTLALVIGLLVVNIIKPGVGMQVKVANLDTSAVQQVVKQTSTPTTGEFLLGIIPDNIIQALATNNLLQVLFFAILMGIALSQMPQKAKPLLQALHSVEQAFFSMIKIIMKFAPIGAFGAMAFTIAKYGVGSLTSLSYLLLSFYITCILFIVLVLGSILKYNGFNLFKLLGYLKEELLIVLGTSSSEAAMPSLINKLENAGCSAPIVGLVVPTGYSFNLDGTSIYLTMAAIFLAQATNTPLSVVQQISLLLILLLTSKGAAGVTGSGFITLAATLPIVGNIPVASIALILGIDRFMSEGRAITNIIGNAVATIVVAKWENEIDLPQAQKLLN